MAAYSYNKQIVSPILFSEIESGLGITPESINYNEITFDFDVVFSITLSGPQQTTLDNIVSNHIFIDTSNNDEFNSLSASTLTVGGVPYSANTDTFVTSGTFNQSTDTLELTKNDGNQVDISLSALTNQTVRYFNAYDGAGGTTASITNIWVDVPLGTERFNDDDFSHSTSTNNEEVTIQKDGTYLLLGSISTEGSISTSRSQAETRLVLDTGGGYNQVNGTLGQIYNRQSSFGGSASFVTPLTLSIGDKVKMQYRRTNGSTPIVLQPNSSSLTIVNIKGPKGDKGDVGSTSGLTHDIQEVYSTPTTSTISSTPVDLGGMTLTTKDLGGPATYQINYTVSRSNSFSNSLNFFYINVDGVRVAQKRVRSYVNEIHSAAGSATVTGVTANTIIKIEYDAQGGGTHTAYERSMSISGILDANVV